MKSEQEINDIYFKLQDYRETLPAGFERARVTHYISLINYILGRARKDNSLNRILEC